jgi:hypothetical protein
MLAVLVAVVAWMLHALHSPALQEAVARKKGTGSRPSVPETAPIMPLQAAQNSPQFSAGGVDHDLQTRADRLHSEEHGTEQDLQIVAEFLETYARATGGQPIGENADITAALTGTQYPGQKGRVFPQNHRALRNGQLIDRWGQPFWFHPNSGSSMEIRSAGPDRQLFTPDDVMLNPSPGGFGATPPGVPEMPQ